MHIFGVFVRQMQIKRTKIFPNTTEKWRDFIGREIHVTAVQPPLIPTLQRAYLRDPLCVTHSTNFAFVFIFADVPTTRGFLPFDWVRVKRGTDESVNSGRTDGREGKTRMRG